MADPMQNDLETVKAALLDAGEWLLPSECERIARVAITALSPRLSAAKDDAREDDKSLVEVDPVSVALVLRQCRVTFGGVEQTSLPERAAALIQSQAADKARIEALEAALRPFADCPAGDPEFPDDDDIVGWGITPAHIRHARATLEATHA